MNYSTIMVLYHPDLNLVTKNIETLLNKSDIKKIVVVDNSPEESTSEIFDNERVQYLFLGDNQGIAYAQNRGMDQLEKEEIDAIFFFDQDTIINLDYIINITKKFEEVSTKEKLGIIGPKILEEGEVFTPSETLEEADQVISSGSLVSYQAYKEVDGFNEWLFLDYVDFDFSWKLKAKGYKIFVYHAVTLVHKVGQKIIKIGNKHIYVPAPFRYYYIYRNGSYLMKQSYVPEHWKKRERLLRVVTPFIVLFLLDDKKERWKHIRRGMKDGK